LPTSTGADGQVMVWVCLLLGGESDVRSCYTAMAVATGLCLDAKALAAKAGMVDYIRRCQVRCCCRA
jgi:prenyltransferase beta subunit